MSIAQQIAALDTRTFDRQLAARAVVGSETRAMRQVYFPDGSTIGIDDTDNIVFITNIKGELLGGTLYPNLNTTPVKDYTDQWTEPEPDTWDEAAGDQWAEPDIAPPGTQSRNNTPQF